MAIIGCIGVVVMYMLMTLVGLIADSRKEMQNDRIYNDLFAISNRYAFNANTRERESDFLQINGKNVILYTLLNRQSSS